MHRNESGALWAALRRAWLEAGEAALAEAARLRAMAQDAAAEPTAAA